MTVGVLAFHGDFAEHIEVLESLNVKAIEIRSLGDLARCDRLIIPGGESTVMARFLDMTGVGKEIIKRVRKNSLFVYGTCAGAILVAKKTTGRNAPTTLGLMDIIVQRNAYGTQAQSFATDLRVKGIKTPVHAAFIRAPIIANVGRNTQILCEYKGHPVLVREGNVLAGTFHPEVRGANEIHKLFLSL